MIVELTSEKNVSLLQNGSVSSYKMNEILNNYDIMSESSSGKIHIDYV